jgi:hypothetical protein
MLAEVAVDLMNAVHLMSTDNTKSDWPFADPKNVAVFTTTTIVRRGHPVLYVSHDDDDGAWQFHSGAEHVSIRDAMIVSLSEMVERDTTLCELADLPCGWIAERDGIGGPWRRMRK